MSHMHSDSYPLTHSLLKLRHAWGRGSLWSTPAPFLPLPLPLPQAYARLAFSPELRGPFFCRCNLSPVPMQPSWLTFPRLTSPTSVFK